MEWWFRFLRVSCRVTVMVLSLTNIPEVTGAEKHRGVECVAVDPHCVALSEPWSDRTREASALRAGQRGRRGEKHTHT